MLKLVSVRDKIYNCETVDFMQSKAFKADCILTSPPYNTCRAFTSEHSRKTHQGRYDIYTDTKTPEEYITWTLNLFDNFNRHLKENGVILYNVSYSSDRTVNSSNNDTVWRVVSSICCSSEFTVADKIVWKKSSALPNNTSPNSLTRICEDIFVFCRKSELKTFYCNKEVSSVRESGQKMYRSVTNFIQARNNDGSCALNKATFSSDLVKQLLYLYCPKGGLVFDPFMGTGTTAVGAVQLGMHYVGTELSSAQCDYARERLNKYENSEICGAVNKTPTKISGRLKLR